MDLNQKFNIAIQLNKAFNTRNEEKNIAVIKYSESTQTYYSDENLAKEHVKQITQKDINTAKHASYAWMVLNLTDTRLISTRL